MLLIYIDDSTIHNIDNAVTYKFRSKSDYMPDHVEAIGASPHHEEHSYGTWVAEGPHAEVFWSWLKSQSMIPMPRPQSLMPEVDAQLTPRKLSAFERGDVFFAPPETEEADDDGFNPRADNGGLHRSTDVRCTDPDSAYYNRIGKVMHFHYDEEDGRGLFLAHIDVKFGKDRSVTLEPRQVIDIPF